MNLLVNGANTMPANSFLCSGTNYIISAPSGFLYTWNGPGITGVTTQTINPTIVGIYTLSLAYTNPSTNTCLTSTPTFTFGLIDTPTANFTVAPRCYGFTTNFVNTTGSSSANNSIGVINTYTWDLGDGSPDVNNVNPNYTYVGGNSNNAYTVTLTASANGCVNQISKPATIFANPSVAVTTGSLCVGTSITLNASGATTYSWSNAATGSSVSVSPNSDINYVVTGTDINGCKNSAVASVSVFPIPPVSVTSGTTCPNQGLSIFAGGATTYTWVASPTLFPHDSNNNEAVVFPTTPTTYTVYGADNNGCINSGTTTVYTSVPPDFSLTTATVCPNITATLVATAISPISSFFWSNGTNALETIASATATTIYTCTANTDNGCSSAKTTTLYVYPSPVLGSASGSVCSGKPFTLNASGAVSYTWSTGSNNASIVVSPTVTTSYLFSGASANGCVGNSIVTVTVVPLPNVFIAPKSVCLGKSVVLTALGGGNYTWSNNATTQTISVSPTANTTYTCIGLALTGCSNTAVTTVTVFPTPTVALTTASICAGQTATITAAAANTYTWSTGNHSSSIYVLPIVSTSYSCVGLSVNNCEYTSTTVVNVTSVATPSISQNGAILTSSSATGNQWYLNGVTIPGATGQTHITSQNGNYSLIVTIGSCSSNSVNKTILDTGLEDFDLKNNLVVFPNPTSNNVSIKLISSDETVTVKIYNATGQYLKTTTITGQNVFIDLQNEAKGLYLFECSLKQHKAFFKVIKM